MNKASRMIFKLLAVIFFLLAVASVLATLFAAPSSSQSPGLFLAVVLAGLGKWLSGKSQGKSAQRTFGRAIEIPELSDEMETPDDRGKKILKPQRDVADGMGDRGKSSGSI
jgi:flagellar biosynthesis component FlhA